MIWRGRFGHAVVGGEIEGKIKGKKEGVPLTFESHKVRKIWRLGYSECDFARTLVSIHMFGDRLHNGHGDSQVMQQLLELL